MMSPVLALDLTCLFISPLNRTPRGIDRVEFAYARYFLAHWPEECVAVLPTPWGVRFFDRARAIRGIGAVEELWREKIEPEHDPVYKATKLALAGVKAMPDASVQRPLPSFSEKVRGFYRIIATAGFSFGRSCKRSLPKNAIYLNVGQLEILRAFFWWLHRRPDVLSVFMVHDVIPIEYPDHHTPDGVKMHHAIMRNVAESAKALIVPSEAARKSVLGELTNLSTREYPTHVELLPVPTAFLGAATPDSELATAQYFIVCGVIDAHKNHLLLLKVWERLVERYGAAAPKLVIAGFPGSTCAPAMSFLGACESIRGHVIVSSGMSTPALRRLIIGARALLMPSIAEGFGFPIVEALAQGTPVVASDIPAHREAGIGGDVTYIGAADEAGWFSCIETMARAPKTAEPNEYRPKTWVDYFRGVESFLSELGR